MRDGAGTHDRVQVDDCQVQLVRKPIRSLRLHVRPDGSAWLSIPERLSQQAALDYLERNREWLGRARARALEAAARERGLVAGATVQVWGRQLIVAESALGAGLSCTEQEVLLPAEADQEQRRSMLARWRVSAVQQALPPLLALWQPRIDAWPSTVRVRAMSSRWGSCTPARASIRLNSALSAHPPACLEYVLVHELVHLQVSGHGPRFHALLGEHLPDWQARRDLLRVPRR